MKIGRSLGDRHNPRWVVGLVLWTVLAWVPHGDLAALPPGLGYAYPPVVTAGTETQVQLGGFDFTPDMQWFVHHDSVRLEADGALSDFFDTPSPYWTGPRAGGPSLPIPREVAARIRVPADTPAGLVRWQVANANGSSATAMFYVSRGHEITESRSRDFPQLLPNLPLAVSGRISRLTEVDRYEFIAQATGLVSVEVMARRLGSDFQAVVEVHDSAGNLLADLSDTQGLDGGVCFAANSGQHYMVSIRDADFRGDRAYVYRLAFTSGPRIACTLPASGQRGTTGEIAFIGYGLIDGKPELQRISQLVTLPADPNLESFQIPVMTSAGVIDAVLPLSNLQEVTLPHPDLKEESPTSWRLPSPIAVTARLPADVEEHRYVWRAEKDQTWKIGLLSRAIGARLDVSLAILDPAGNVISEVDDSGGTSDASLEFRAGESGDYSCTVRSLSTRSGALDEIYRLELAQPAPDFSLTIPQQINIPSGGTAEITIQAARSGGFAGEIAIAMTGQPEGLEPAGAWMIPAGAGEAKLQLKASAEAAVSAAMLTFQGSGQSADETLTRTATAVAAGNLSPRTANETRVKQALAAVTMTAPFEIMVVDRDRQHEVSRGTTFLADVELVRKPLGEGKVRFAGPIRLETSANQQRYRAGIRSTAIDVPAEISRAQFPCFMPEWLATDLTQRMLIHGVAVVPDPKGNLRYLSKAADARITMIMEGALLKLSTTARDVVAPVGQAIEIPVSILRSPTFPAPTTIELLVPEEAAELLTAQPLVLGPETGEGVLKIASVADARLLGPWTLRLRATALQQGGWPVVSELELPIEFSR